VGNRLIGKRYKVKKFSRKDGKPQLCNLAGGVCGKTGTPGGSSKKPARGEKSGSGGFT